MDIENGSIYRVDLSGAADGARDGQRPFLAVQSDILNASRLNTVVMMAMTNRPEFSLLPGNVTLEPGEANLPESYTINVSQLMTFAKSALGSRIGHVGKERMRQVYEGVRLVLGMD